MDQKSNKYHMFSESYNAKEVLKKLHKEFCFENSFYFKNLHCYVFKNKSFQIKLLIQDRKTEEIIFENVYNDTNIFCNDLQSDSFLYCYSLSNSTITKFNNPILSDGLIKQSIKKHHSFIELSKSINDVIIKDELIYISINIAALEIEWGGNEIEKTKTLTFKKEKDYISPIDKLFDDIPIRNSSLILGVNTKDLSEVNRHIFNIEDNPIIIHNKNIDRKNSILVEAYDGYFMENIIHLVDLSNNFVKQFHPPYLTLSNKTHVLVMPWFDYNVYSDFKVVRLSDMKEIDVYNILPQNVVKDIENEFIHNSIIYNHILLTADKLIIKGHTFSCRDLFSTWQEEPKTIEEQKQSNQLIRISGEYFDGVALGIQTIKNTLNKDGSYDTLKTELGELLHQLKYNYDKSVIEIIAPKCASVINELFPDVDVIIPAPPSNLNRPFQPVYELAKTISELTKIKLDLSYLIKLPTEEIKFLKDSEIRKKILDIAISIKDDRYRNKNILLLDDSYRSGDTLNVISGKMIKKGSVNSIKALCVCMTNIKHPR